MHKKYLTNLGAQCIIYMLRRIYTGCQYDVTVDRRANGRRMEGTLLCVEVRFLKVIQMKELQEDNLQNAQKKHCWFSILNSAFFYWHYLLQKIITKKEMTFYYDIYDKKDNLYDCCFQHYYIIFRTNEYPNASSDIRRHSDKYHI